MMFGVEIPRQWRRRSGIRCAASRHVRSGELQSIEYEILYNPTFYCQEERRTKRRNREVGWRAWLALGLSARETRPKRAHREWSRARQFIPRASRRAGRRSFTRDRHGRRHRRCRQVGAARAAAAPLHDPRQWRQPALPLGRAATQRLSSSSAAATPARTTAPSSPSPCRKPTTSPRTTRPRPARC